MANQYLIEVHKFITLKIKTAQSEKNRAAEKGDDAQTNFYTGQIEELMLLREFLKTNFDLTTQRYY